MDIEKNTDGSEIVSSDIDEVISFSEKLVDEQTKPSRPFKQHFNATIEMFGDKSTLTQVVMLLACVRSIIKSQTPGEIRLNIGKHVASDNFAFSVNGQEIVDVKLEGNKTAFEIN